MKYSHLSMGLMAIVAFAAFNMNFNINNIGVSYLSLANIEALAQNEANPCPNPYDAWERVLDYRQETKTVTASADGTLTIGNWKGINFKANKTYSCTYSMGDCLTPCPSTCCDNSKIGDVINVSVQ